MLSETTRGKKCLPACFVDGQLPTPVSTVEHFRLSCANWLRYSQSLSNKIHAEKCSLSIPIFQVFFYWSRDG